MTMLLMLSLATLGVDGPSRAAIAWSPSGEWIAYTLSAGASDSTPGPGWLFDVEPSTDAARRDLASNSLKTRLWLTRADGKGSVSLDRCDGVMTALAWKPDATAIAYGKLSVDPATGAGRFSIVVRDGPDRERSLWSIDLADARAEIARVRDAALAWSPDGRTLAATRLRPEGLVIVRVDDGKVMKQLDAASLPSWSPKGDRLAFQRAGAPPSIELIDADWETSKRVADLFVFQPPIWSVDGDSLFVLAPQGVPWRQVDVSRIDSGTNRTLAARSLFITPGARPVGAELVGAALALDADRSEWFAVLAQSGQPSRITRGPTSMTPNMGMRVSGPVGPSPVWSMSVGPGNKRLALRVGPAALPAFWDPGTEILSPIAPNEATLRDWTALIVDDARARLEESHGRATVNGKGVSRPTILPTLGEQFLPGDSQARLRRLVKIGRPLCELTSIWRDRATGAIDPFRDEARLFFAALDDDPAAALIALDSVESRAADVEGRLRLLALRGQLLLALGEVERARGVADYLRLAADASITRRRLESTTHGPSLIAEDADDVHASLLDQWSSLLNAGIVEVERQAVAADSAKNPNAAHRPSRVHRVRPEQSKQPQFPRFQPQFNQPPPAIPFGFQP